MLKKLLLSLIILIISCGEGIEDTLVINHSRQVFNNSHGKYIYGFEGHHHEELYLITDSIYTIGDTLYLSKIKCQ